MAYLLDYLLGSPQQPQVAQQPQVVQQPKATQQPQVAQQSKQKIEPTNLSPLALGLINMAAQIGNALMGGLPSGQFSTPLGLAGLRAGELAQNALYNQFLQQLLTGLAKQKKGGGEPETGVPFTSSPAILGTTAASALSPKLQDTAFQTALAISEQPYDILYKKAMAQRMLNAPTFEQQAALELTNTLLSNLLKPSQQTRLSFTTLPTEDGKWNRVVALDPYTGEIVKEIGRYPVKETGGRDKLPASIIEKVSDYLISYYAKKLGEGFWRELQKLQDPASRVIRVSSVLAASKPELFIDFLNSLRQVTGEETFDKLYYELVPKLTADMADYIDKGQIYKDKSTNQHYIKLEGGVVYRLEPNVGRKGLEGTFNLTIPLGNTGETASFNIRPRSVIEIKNVNEIFNEGLK